MTNVGICNTLGGGSLGGLIALEMARLLRQRGQPVPLVVLIDSIAVERADMAAGDEGAALSLFALDMGIGTDELDPLLRKYGTLASRLEAIWRKARARRFVDTDISTADLEWHFRLLQRNLAAFYSHKPRPYDGRVAYFKAAERLSSASVRYRYLDRTELHGSVREWTLPGNHFSLVRHPQVRALADAMRQALGIAEAGGRLAVPERAI